MRHRVLLAVPLLLALAACGQESVEGPSALPQLETTSPLPQLEATARAVSPTSVRISEAELQDLETAQGTDPAQGRTPSVPELIAEIRRLRGLVLLASSTGRPHPSIEAEGRAIAEDGLIFGLPDPTNAQAMAQTENEQP